jgi:hypothetical protein
VPRDEGKGEWAGKAVNLMVGPRDMARNGPAPRGFWPSTALSFLSFSVHFPFLLSHFNSYFKFPI